MIFYLDTSSEYLYFAIKNNQDIICNITERLGRDLSVYTVDRINKAMEKACIKPTDIDKIIVVTGPGSFTGIRIGVTIAKIFAFTLNKKITTITSLDAMIESSDSDFVKVALIDARRGYVYAKIVDHDQVIMEDCHISLEKLFLILHGLRKKYCIITNNNFDFDTVSYTPNYLKIINKYQNKEEIHPHLVNPTYFKLTEAEENKGKENDS